MRYSAFLAAVFLAVAPSITLGQQVKVGEPHFSTGGSPVGPGDVYGKATFSIGAYNGNDVAQSVSGLMEALIQSEYNNNDGSYLLTLELTQNGKSLGVVPLVSIEFHNKSFLFFNVSKTISQGITFDGTIATTGPVDQTNNEVVAALKSYYSATSSFDLSLLDELIQYNKQYQVLVKLDPSGALGNVVGAFDDILAKALQRATKNTELFSFTMGFARVSGASPTRIVEIPIGFASQSGNGSLKVLVKTWSESSRFQFDPDTGKYLSPSSTVIFQNAGIPLSGGMDVIQYFQKNGDESVKQFLTQLLSSAGYTGQDITGACRDLLSQYRKFLSNRDALALLWATIAEYHSNFKAAKATACLEDRRADFDTLGLPIDQLIAELS